MDTDVGHWAGQKIDEIAKSDPAWKVFVKNPDEPPAGVESFSAVQARAVAAAKRRWLTRPMATILCWWRMAMSSSSSWRNT